MLVRNRNFGFEFVSDDAVRPTGNGARAGAAGVDRDAELMDAYSQAVVHVVEQSGHAVIAVTGRREAGRGDTGGRESRGGSGSGFIVTPDGFALTNSHVVNGRLRLTAITHDGDALDADVIGDDPATDIALLRISASDLPAIRMGDSGSLRVGQLVVAMGSPFGLQSTVSSGIVSAAPRSMRGVGGRLIDGVLQHTAPINPGNSGGPLLNTRGQVVGVNTATIAFAQGVGFAVPANTAQFVLSELLAHGRVRRVVLGIAAGTVQIPRRIVRALDLMNDSGVRVEAVEAGGAAARAGLREEDVIVELDGRVVSSVDDLHRLLARLTPAAVITLTVLRGERRVEVRVGVTA